MVAEKLIGQLLVNSGGFESGNVCKVVATFGLGERIDLDQVSDWRRKMGLWWFVGDIWTERSEYDLYLTI